ncbi:MAG: 3-dehydroquinate synthase [Bacilli bacterium]|nr:3-dehydroquinate synthase [Bacilli bacterium]
MSRIIKVNASSEYNIYLGNNELDNLVKYFNLNRKVLVVTDSNIPLEYVNKVLNSCLKGHLVTLNPGEESKCFDNYLKLNKILLENEFSRTDAIVALGGGVIGDLSAFVASTYMRGIDFYNIPTSLLAMVDSSIGGKTAIDFLGVKNVIGSFYQPRGVLIDIDTLDSLDRRQLMSGLVESIKMGLCLDRKLFDLIKNSSSLEENIEEIIYRSIECKRKVVEEDEKEKGLRKVLNYGHTFGHAIEESSALKLLHGEAVGIGMLYFTSFKVKEDLIDVLNRYELPTSYNLKEEDVDKYVTKDKKRDGDKIDIVYLEDYEKFSFLKLSYEEIKDYVKHAR